MRTTKLPMIYAYISEEEKRALDILAAIENRSSSKFIRVELVKILKERGLLKEELNEKGEIVQTVVTSNVLPSNN